MDIWALYAAFFLAYGIALAAMWRDPFLVRTPQWLIILLPIVYLGTGAAIVCIFFLGAVICHGACG